MGFRITASGGHRTQSQHLHIDANAFYINMEDVVKEIKKFSLRGAIALGASLLLAVVGSLPANAEGTASVVPMTQPTADQSKTTLLNMDSQVDSWQALSRPAAAGLADGARAAGVVPQGGLKVDFTGAKAWRVNDTTRMVRIPAADGQGVTDQSSLSVMLSNDGLMIGSSQWIFTPASADSGRVQVWLNGGVVLDQIVTSHGQPTNPTIGTKANMKGDWWGDFNKCLSNAGVAAWAIAGISIACAAVCVVTAGFGCLACLGAASAGFSGTVSFCITHANLNS